MPERVGFRYYSRIGTVTGEAYDVSITINAWDFTTIEELHAAALQAIERLAQTTWRYGPVEVATEPEAYQIIAGGFPQATVDL